MRKPQELRAIAHFAKENNARPELSVFPWFRFTMRDTGTVETKHIQDLVQDYKAAKEAARKGKTKERLS